MGKVYISGQTLGDLEGTNAGGRDAFISKYDASGTFEWTRQFGTSENDSGKGVSADGLGNVYISGSTGGSLWGANAGIGDAFVAKYSDVSEPGDFDGDGTCDGADFLYWQLNDGSQSGLTEWQANFGNVPSAVASREVPEPSGFVLLCGMIAMLFRRHAVLQDAL